MSSPINKRELSKMNKNIKYLKISLDISHYWHKRKITPNGGEKYLSIRLEAPWIKDL